MDHSRQEEVELEKSVRRLREKFHGKVDIPDAVVLMRQFSNNHDLACKRIILCKDELDDEPDMDPEGRGRLGNDPVAQASDNENDKIKDIAQQLKVLSLTEENLRMFNQAKNNQILTRDRQFACQPCDIMWWRRVPKRKEVSRCHRCGTCYDPVPCKKMWGYAEFECPSCQRTFKGFGQMEVPSPCFGCHNTVFPSRILPPRRTQGPRSRHQHSCFAEDCFNRREPHVPGTHCVHPQSLRRNRLPKVLFPSEEHDSTGSTVDTCVSQGSLQVDLDYLILEDLEEVDEEEDGGSSI
uniref:Shiftless antiviral inhibitor of ribosomal frameshifting n=1 Tax=Anolis carolinensis TaxID=28377 RepID=A0A803TR82_ANOCA|nr:PREDICTED: repressor of yield of DENV protein isoform X2 [Anolis carolinensis]|eukprot:XP_008117958.1 PREDICTED: repressor of yield of DENV protein isoform X2 [Anolis carolinensis]